MSQNYRQLLPATGVIRDEQLREYGDLEEYAATQNGILVDGEEVLRYPSRDDLPVIVAKTMTQEVLGSVDGCKSSEHHSLRRTVAELLPRFY